MCHLAYNHLNLYILYYIKYFNIRYTNLQVSHYTVTDLLTGSSYVTINNIDAYIINKRICFLSAKVVWKANMNAGTDYTIATITNTALRPVTFINCPTILGVYTIQNFGNILLRPSINLTSSTGTMYFSAVYITNSNYPN